MRKGSNIVTICNKVIRAITEIYLHKSILTLLCLVAVFISGCSTYEQDFDCPPGVGMGCVSISEVNSVVDKSQESSQQISSIKIEENLNSEEECPTCRLQDAKVSSPVPSLSNIQDIKSGASTLPCSVHRTRERTARIWIAPYEDEEGNFWEEGYVNILLKPSQWNNGVIQ